MQLIVAGFHRSGTSLLTQVLHSAGLFVGRRLLGAMPSNPYGHFEDLDFLELHRSILWAHGDDWQWDAVQPFYLSPDHWQQMRELVKRRDLLHEQWGFKDPRTCFFLGAWKHLMPDAKVVVVYRDPADSVQSLEKRQAGAYLRGEGARDRHARFFREPDHGLKLWDTYNRALVSFVEQNLDDCLVVPFSELTAGLPIVSTVNDRLGCRLDEVDTQSIFDAGATRERDVPQRVHDPLVAQRVGETWAALQSLHRATAPDRGEVVL